MRIAEASLDGFVAALAGERPSPGAGAAAGVALALAAGCAAKALRISAKHHPDRDLDAAADEAEQLAREALTVAQLDSEDFPALLNVETKAEASEALARDGELLLGVAARLASLLEARAGDVTPALEGDIAAARHLLQAAERIGRRNLAELD